jgi:hypothetical protein
MLDVNALKHRCHEALYEPYEAPPGAAAAAAGPAGPRVALGLSFMEIERGVSELEALVGDQRPDGLYVDAQGGIALPLHGTVARSLYFMVQIHRHELRPRLTAVVAQLERWHERLYARRGSSLHISSPADQRLFPDDPPAAQTIDVGFNALLTQSESDLADAAIHCGHSTQRAMVRRTKRAQAMLRKLWCEERQLYGSRVRDAGDDGFSWREPSSAVGLLALFSGVALPAQANVMVERYLTPGSGFATEVPPSTLPQEDPGFDPAVIGRGALCPVLVFLVITGLHRYGFDEQALRLTEVLKRLVLEQGPRQGYHALTGEGIGEVDPVTASVILHLVLAPFNVAQISHF